MRPRPQFEGAEYRPAGKLRGKNALITGGDSGIGRAVSVFFAKEGADVAIVHLPEEQSDAQETRRAVEAEGRRCVLLPGDVSDPTFCRQAIDQTTNELGSLDILVNNAAYQSSRERLEDVSIEQWDRTFRTNIYGYFFMAREALRHMKAGSAIINTGSVVSMRGSKKLLDYSATKGAIETFTKSLAQNLAPRGIRVNCIAPGPIWTPLQSADPGKKTERFGEQTPMGRPGQPEEVAPAYVFFASNADSSYISGEVLAIQGGEVVS